MASYRTVEKKLVPLLQELIRNKCVNDGTPDSGQEVRSAETLNKFFSKHGIKTTILESHPGRSNLLVRIPGKDPKAPSLMYMGHLDVVPANSEEWSCDPFSGDKRGGYIWGRGAVDMLNMTASQAVAVAELVNKRDRFPGDFIYLAVADEEASGRLGARWLVEKHWDKVKADYMVTELGGFFIHNKKGLGITISCGEKGIVWVRLKTKGTAGHGSLPFHSDNAAVKVGRAVERIARYKPKHTLHEEYLNMIKAIGEDKKQVKALSSLRELKKVLQKIYLKAPGLAKFLHAASCMTMSPNLIKAGSKTNIIPDSGIIEIDIRLLPGQTVEDVVKEIEKLLGPFNEYFTIEIMEYFPANVSPLETPLFTATKEVVSPVYPTAYYVPLFIGSVTDGRFWRNKGTVVYGFSLFDEEFSIDDYASMFHGKDEKISIKSLELAYNYFYKLPEVFFAKARNSL
ncbi:MAG: M20/M25/M40 family metallo-hydrolase [Spirochaetales bacterium]|nr:M20/M25/M40 family metallo-hydrolase [Spirochaetales bacterium]